MTDPRVDALALACAKAGVHIDKRPLDTARDTPCESCLPAVRAILAALDGWTLMETTPGWQERIESLIVPPGVYAVIPRAEVARLRKAMGEAVNMVHMADWDPPTMHEAIARTEAILRAELDAES